MILPSWKWLLGALGFAGWRSRQSQGSLARQGTGPGSNAVWPTGKLWILGSEGTEIRFPYLGANQKIIRLKSTFTLQGRDVRSNFEEGTIWDLFSFAGTFFFAILSLKVSSLNCKNTGGDWWLLLEVLSSKQKASAASQKGCARISWLGQSSSYKSTY